MSLAELIPAENRGPGLTREELLRAQEDAGAAFPEDLVELLGDCLPTGPRFPDWRNEPAGAMNRYREHVLDGILFDVGNDLWFDDWPERPDDPAERRSLVTEIVRGAPELIPIYAHRGIPNEPLERGNPVFSVWQTDVIVYGATLEDYLQREFRDPQRVRSSAGREIRFWTSLALAE